MIALSNCSAVATTNASTTWAEPSFNRASRWPARDRSRKIAHADAPPVEQSVDRGVMAGTAAYLGDDRRWNPNDANECAPLMGDREDGSGCRAKAPRFAA
jgi:hypothetical protein